MERVISALGLIVFLGIAYALSIQRRAVGWRTVAWGLGLEFIVALLILKTPSGLTVFKSLGDVVSNFLAFCDVGAKFVFGDNYKEHLFAFQVLPSIIFFSAFISVLYHYGISWNINLISTDECRYRLKRSHNYPLPITNYPNIVSLYIPISNCVAALIVCTCLESLTIKPCEFATIPCLDNTLAWR